MSRVVNQKSKEVMGEGIGELEMKELVPGWGWRRDEGSWFQRQYKEAISIFLFLERMMSVAEQE